MRRRDFIRLLGISAGAAAVGVVPKPVLARRVRPPRPRRISGDEFVVEQVSHHQEPIEYNVDGWRQYDRGSQWWTATIQVPTTSPWMDKLQRAMNDQVEVQAELPIHDYLFRGAFRVTGMEISSRSVLRFDLTTCSKVEVVFRA